MRIHQDFDDLPDEVSAAFLSENPEQGRERALAAYAHAIRERYRFFSYGDCMLIL